MDIFVGTDIIEIARFGSALLSKQSFLDLSFTAAEQEYCFAKSCPAQHFAVRFAAKEAVTKAIYGLNKKLTYAEIEIYNDENGRPWVRLLTDDPLLQTLKIDVSLSHSESMAMAFAIAYQTT